MDVPEKFREIVRLSDEERAKVALPEGVDASVADMMARPTPLTLAVDAISDEEFRSLMGWTIFGRDYKSDQGNPAEALAQYIRKSVIYPRANQGGYLEEKPIGEYLRAAIEHLTTSPDEKTRRAWNEESRKEELERELREEYLRDEDED